MRSFYEAAYQSGFLPWEEAAAADAERVQRLLDLETAERGDRPGRALDIGCGRGTFTVALGDAGWTAVGVDFVPGAVEAARSRPDAAAATFVLGDATDLPAVVTGPFELFLDVGCFHGFDAADRAAYGTGVTELATGDATLLLLAFEPGAPPPLPGGVVREEVEAALPAWEVVGDELVPAPAPPRPQVPAHWYRLRRRQPQ
jgi:SAM-dependent methyltransferase